MGAFLSCTNGYISMPSIYQGVPSYIPIAPPLELTKRATP
jgi:hypothetical protein